MDVVAGIPEIEGGRLHRGRARRHDHRVGRLRAVRGAAPPARCRRRVRAARHPREPAEGPRTHPRRHAAGREHVPALRDEGRQPAGAGSALAGVPAIRRPLARHCRRAGRQLAIARGLRAPRRAPALHHRPFGAPGSGASGRRGSPASAGRSCRASGRPPTARCSTAPAHRITRLARAWSAARAPAGSGTSTAATPTSETSREPPRRDGRPGQPEARRRRAGDARPHRTGVPRRARGRALPPTASASRPWTTGPRSGSGIDG